jgi:hypothetical protein
MAEIFISNDLERSYMRMEQELYANGFLLNFKETLELKGYIAACIAKKKNPYGLIFPAIGPQDIGPVLAQLDRLWKGQAGSDFRTPVLIDLVHAARISRMPPQVHVIHRGNISTIYGRTIARYLVNSKHKEACFFYKMPNWFNLGFWGYLKIRPELKDISPDFKFRLVIGAPGKKEKPSEIMNKMVELYPELHSFNSVAPIYGYNSFRQYCEEAVKWGDFASIYKRFPRARIWVFAMDSSAAEALAWAKSAGMRVPRDLSIVSSENSPAYYHHGITCFAADWDRIGYLMAHAIIGDISVEKTAKGYLRMATRVVEKLTT